MKKVVLIGNHDIVIYNFRKELIEKLIAENFEVYLILPYGKKVDLLIEMGCKFYDLPIDRRGTNIISDLLLLRNYVKILRKIKPNVVLTYTIKPNIYGGIACRINKIPYIANITGLGSAVENKGILQKVTMMLYKLAFKNINCIFFQNKKNRKIFINRGIAVGKDRLIPGSGVNLNEHSLEDYPKDKIIKILFIGRLMREKGIYELFDVAKKICLERDNVRFELIGFCEENIEIELQELVEQNIIFYYGQQENVHQFIKESHAVILPSYHEGMANVLLEAASTGRPVLASNIPGCIETFEEGVSGFGFEPKDVESLYDSILKFLDLPYEIKRLMGILGRERMKQNFSRDIVIESYMKEIENI